MPGVEVVARGVACGAGALVAVGGQNAEVLDAQPTQVRFRVPADVPVVPGQGVTVSLRLGNEQAKPATLFLGQLPFLLEAAPARGEAGERVVLKGRGFDPDPAGNLVMFGDRPALVLQASANGADRGGAGHAGPAAIRPADRRARQGPRLDQPRRVRARHTLAGHLRSALFPGAGRGAPRPRPCVRGL